MIKLHEFNLNSNFNISRGRRDYCPISKKDAMNPPVLNYLDTLSNNDIFLSPKNVHYMTYFLISLNVKNKTGAPLFDLAKQVPQMMKEWAEKENLNDFEYIYDDILLVLAFLNEKFLVNNACIYDRANLLTRNVFRINDRVTDRCGNQSLKPYDQMLASDYHTLDLWETQHEYTYDKRNRYGNKIPVWQSSMNIRQYDKSNDGLSTANPDRASLDVFQRGYDMSNQIKGSTSYENYFYENN